MTANDGWRPVRGYVGAYEVNPAAAEVRSVDREIVDSLGYTRRRRGRILIPSIDERGHRRVSLSQHNRRRTRLVATLIREATERQQ